MPVTGGDYLFMGTAQHKAAVNGASTVMLAGMRL